MFEYLMRILRDPDPAGAGGAGGAGTAEAEAGAGGAGTAEAVPEWLAVLPEEAAKDPAITKYKTPEDFYKGYKSTVELVGRKGVIVPNEKSTPEEREAFLNATGRPEKPEGYKFNKVEGLTPEFAANLTPEFDQGLALTFHKRGVSAEAADGLRQDFVNMLHQSEAQQTQREVEAAKAAGTALRQEWGPKYEANVALVTKGLMKTGGQEVLDAMGGEKGIGNSPVVLKTLAKVFGLLSEDQINTITPPGGSAEAGSKEQALAQITAMMTDKTHPIHNQNDPKHAAAVEERMKLYRLAYPEGSA